MWCAGLLSGAPVQSSRHGATLIYRPWVKSPRAIAELPPGIILALAAAPNFDFGAPYDLANSQGRSTASYHVHMYATLVMPPQSTCWNC